MEGRRERAYSLATLKIGNLSKGHVTGASGVSWAYNTYYTVQVQLASLFMLAVLSMFSGCFKCSL